MTSLRYTDSAYQPASHHSAHSAMYPLAPAFPPSPSAYVIDPMSPSATFGSQPHAFPSLYTSHFSLPPAAFSDPAYPSSSLSSAESLPALDDESLLLEPSPVRLTSYASVSDSCDSSSLSGSRSPFDSPFVLPLPTDSSASSSLSSASSVASDSTPPPGKRRRVSPLTKEQRAAINKAKHKEIDAARRQREAAVVKQLQRLTRRKHEREDDDNDDDQHGGDDELPDDLDDVEEGRRDKVSVLEESAATIAQLRALCRRMRRACNAKDHSIRNLQQHLSAIAVAKTHALNASRAASVSSSSDLTLSDLSDPSSHPTATTSSLLSFLPEPTSSYLSQLDRSHALYTSTFVRSPLALVLIAIPSGISLDVNEVFERSTGWTRQDIVGTLIGPPADGSRPKHRLNPMVLRRRKDGKTQLRDGEGEEDGWWGRRYLRQYPSSKLSMKEVWRGESKKVEVVWRVVMADGSIYECGHSQHTAHPLMTMYTIWLADADWASDGQGGYELRPHQMVLASAYGDAVRVDEWPKEDEMGQYLNCGSVKKEGGEVPPPPPEEQWKRKAPRGVQIDSAKLAGC